MPHAEKALPVSLHIVTPLLRSTSYSARLGRSVWFKMEALQPPGSFKARGVGHACQTYKEWGAKRFVCSSGGNAGIAVAYSGRMLGVPVTVVVPETTSAAARERIAAEGADLVVHGRAWSEANDHALSLMRPEYAFIHPFDDPLLWEGHATMIDEVAAAGVKPGAVLLSVGGGGLLCGVLAGLERNGWHDVPVIAAETVGADSYAASLAAGAQVELPTITSIATSLGAKSPCAKSLEWSKLHPIVSEVVTDKEAVGACLRFLAEHRIVVEPACGAALAALERKPAAVTAASDVLVIVCGGAGATAEQLQAWDRAA